MKLILDIFDEQQFRFIFVLFSVNLNKTDQGHPKRDNLKQLILTGTHMYIARVYLIYNWVISCGYISGMLSEILNNYERVYIQTYRHTDIQKYIHSTFHSITLHYVTSHYIALHFITLQYSTLHYITLYTYKRLYIITIPLRLLFRVGHHINTLKHAAYILGMSAHLRTLVII